MTSQSGILDYQLRRSQRAKRLHIVVKPGLIEVVAPLKISDQQIQHFVASHQDWIKSAWQRVKEKTQEVPSLAPSHYRHGVTIPFQGQQIPLLLKYTLNKSLRIQFSQDCGFIIHLPEGFNEQESSELIRQGLTRWMKTQARQQAKHLLDIHSQQTNLTPRSFKIKSQKSRWGSCGPLNDINLNWLLILAPPEIFTYVIIHELCHIEHKNHSNDFWQLVSQHCPDYSRHRLWLKQHGSSLMKGL